MNAPVLELEGTWEEIEARQAELRGRYLRVTAFDSNDDNTLASPLTAETAKRYPSALEGEYNSLIHKKLHHSLTETESTRLQQVRNVIAEIDRLINPTDIREQQATKLLDELIQIRTELEALPDL